MYVSTLTHNDHGSKILYYHDVFATVNYRALDADIQMGTPLELFRQHIEIIRKEGYEIVERISKAKGQVAIMFDDGFRGIWECRQYFYDQGLCPTIFLAVDYIGRKDLGLLTADEILELQEYGFIFQSHTCSHRPLTNVPTKELSNELQGSKEKLELILGKPVESLCMPLGFFTQELLLTIKDAGYKEIYSCIPGNAHEAPYGLIARNLVQYTQPYELKLIMRGANDLLKSRYCSLHEKC